VVSIDARQLSATEINRKIKEVAETSGEITILNPQARHNIAVGVLKPCKINVEGSVGYYGASLMDGPEVHISGNAGWALGENLMGGKITVTKDAGASVAASMRDGDIYVGRNVGARAGISMKGGTLLVGGNSGFLTGFMMQKGRIIVCGDVGDAVGDSMYEGVIYIGGEIGSLGADAREEEISEGELIELWDVLEQHGITEKPRFRKIVSEKKLYHFDTLERLEMSAV
jgi:glutamate synthase domain-containing protein 3